MPPQIDPQQLIQLLTMLLTTAPQQPNGTIEGGRTPMGPPAGADSPNPLMGELAGLLQLLQRGNAANGPVQAQNAAMGRQGASFGVQGGRPMGS